MKSFKPLVVLAALLLFGSPAKADDVITNIMSPIVSYQYPDNFSSQALTNGGILSPIASYQFLEWPGYDILSLKYSPKASYYYPFLDDPVLTITPTNRTPTIDETSLSGFPQNPLPPFSKLQVFNNDVFVTNGILNTNLMTIVLTHGWNSDPAVWAQGMAANLVANGVNANLVAWNWKDTASSWLTDPKRAGSQAPGEGYELGSQLLNALGSGYSKRIHFIGHSFGTLVNAAAANFLQGTNFAGEGYSSYPWPATNMAMTLFDEAEVGADKNILNPSDLVGLAAALAGYNDNYLNLPAYYHPLPRQFAWADNFVSEFGLLHSNAANVILTAGSPANAPNPAAWISSLTAFHGYPASWYDETIQTDISAMGFRWSFERGGWFSLAPTNGTVFVQTDINNPWNLVPTNWNDGAGLLIGKIHSYGSALGSSFVQFAGNTLTANGTVQGQALTTGLPSWMLNMSTSSGSSGMAPAPLKAIPLGSPTPNGAGGATIIPAYVWGQIIIPPNTVSMSFNYKIQGDWQSDSLAAALNGTNVLLIAGNTIQTNIVFSSGAIDVSSFAGQTNEFFVGIVGGTSTNAQLTVENLVFSISSPPSLQAQASGNDCVLSWPLSAADYTLETSTNLISWTVVTNIPTVANLQNASTNPISIGARFYRLRK